MGLATDLLRACSELITRGEWQLSPNGWVSSPRLIGCRRHAAYIEGHHSEKKNPPFVRKTLLVLRSECLTRTWSTMASAAAVGLIYKPNMHLFHIPQCSTQKRQAYLFWMVHCVIIYEICLLWYASMGMSWCFNSDIHKSILNMRRHWYHSVIILTEITYVGRYMGLL